MRAISSFVLILFSASGLASTSGFNGLYGGAALGASLTTAEIESETFSSVDFHPLAGLYQFHLNNNTSPGSEDFKAALFFGYGHHWDVFYLGAELYGSLSRYEMRDSNDTGYLDTVAESDTTVVRTQIGLNAGEFGFDLRPGFLLNPNTLLYMRIGVAVNELTSKTQGTTTDAFFGEATPESFAVNAKNSESVTRGALRLGAGLEHYISEHLSLRGDYIYTYYGQIESSASGTATAESVNLGGKGVLMVNPSTNSKITNNTAMLGLSYYLEPNPDVKNWRASAHKRELEFDGFYIGATAGAGLTQAQADIKASSTLFFTYVPGNPLIAEVPINSDTGMNHDMIAAGMYAGYGWSWNNWHLALQFFADYEKVYMEDTEGDGGFLAGFGPPGSPGEQFNSHAATKLKLNSVEYGLDLLPGYVFRPDLLFYVRIGAAFNEANMKNEISGFYNENVPPLIFESFSLNSEFNETDHLIGLRLGGGLEVMLTEHLALRGDYIYTLYSSIHSSGTEIEPLTSQNFGPGSYTTMHNTRVNLYNNAVLLGLSYYL